VKESGLGSNDELYPKCTIPCALFLSFINVEYTIALGGKVMHGQVEALATGFLQEEALERRDVLALGRDRNINMQG